MAERACRATGCTEELSDRLPPEFLVCGQHQLVGLKVLADHPELERTPRNISFFSLYSKGCFASILAEFVGVAESTFCRWLRLGRIKADKVSEVGLNGGTPGCYWWIQLPVAIKVVDLFQNWVRPCQVCKGKVAPGTYLLYTEQGRLGRVRETPSGYPVIHRSVIPRLDQIFRTQKWDGCRKRHPVNLESGEVSIAVAMDLVPIDLRYRVKRETMPGGKRDGRWVTTWEGVLEVALEIVHGELVVKDRKIVLRVRRNLRLIRRRASESKAP